MPDLFGITVLEQIACAEREVAMRKRAYPRFVENGNIRQDKADREIEVMESIVETLKQLKGD
ncbi:MAG TPA: hypothetical protein ENG78_07720 [Acidiferrobacteraceae bacterium]|nr:hypothetical protein [Acidiferrobacteraceae bacterium]HEX20689.1 hypothetical protein [Acidiferrobacteraceae bacterium]